MDTRRTRRRRTTARSLALAVLAASMLPLNGCIGPLAGVLPMLSSAMGFVGNIMNLGKTIGGLGGQSAASPLNLSSMPTFDGQTPFGINPGTQNSQAAAQYVAQGTQDTGGGIDLSGDKPQG